MTDILPNRRYALKVLAGAGPAIWTASKILGSANGWASTGRTYPDRVLELVRDAFTIDLKHALSLNPNELKGWLTNPHSFTGDVRDLFRATGLNVIQTTLETYDDTRLDYGLHNGFLAVNSDFFMRVDRPEDFKEARRTKRIGMILGSENSNHFKTLDDIDRYHALGQRVSQLTYNKRNLIGSGATERSDGGLSDFGVDVVKRMNAVGMAIDLSHCGDRTTLDAIEASTKPVIFTHAAARALNPKHPRTKSDDAIRKMAQGGGVMGIAFLRVLIRDREPTTIEHALDHFEYVARLVGVEHVAVGSDIALYGYDALPRALVEASKANLKPGTYQFRERDDIDGLDHPRRLFDLAEGLLRRGFNESEVRLILGGNARRVLTRIWRV